MDQKLENQWTIFLIAFSLNQPQGRFSQVVAISVCVSFAVFVPLRLIVNYAQTIKDLLFCHEIYCIDIFTESARENSV